MPKKDATPPRKGKAPGDRGLVRRKNKRGEWVWYVRLHVEGKMRWFGAFPTKTEARQLYQDAKADQRRGQFFPHNLQTRGAKRVADVIDEYMRFNTKRSIADDRNYARFWKARLPTHRLANITPALLDTIKGELLGTGRSNQTVLHYLKFLRHIFNIAVRDRCLHQNPFTQVELPKTHKGRLRYLSLEEERRLLQAIGPVYAPWVRFAILTGLRQAEQFRLRWTDVDLERGLVTLNQTKAGGSQLVYLNQEAVEILRQMPSWKDSAWVFPSQRQGTPMDPKNFYHRVYVPALQRAGLQPTKGDRGRADEDRSLKVDWHTLRHTFASRLGMSGATEQEIAACLRHSGTTLVKRYTHLSQPHLHTVTERVSQFGRPLLNPPTGDPTVDKSEIAMEGKGGLV